MVVGMAMLQSAANHLIHSISHPAENDAVPATQLHHILWAAFGYDTLSVRRKISIMYFQGTIVLDTCTLSCRTDRYSLRNGNMAIARARTTPQSGRFIK